MARNFSKLKDSKYRKETKEERAARLEAAAEARDKCLRLFPFLVALCVGLMVLFSFYVHAMAPEAKTTKTSRKTPKVTKTARTTPKAKSVPEPDEETKKTVGAMRTTKAASLEENMAKSMKSTYEAKTPHTDEEINALLEEAIRNGALDEARAILDKERKEHEAVKAIPEEQKGGETEEL